MNNANGGTAQASTSLTIALCTHNHAERLQRTLRALERIDSPDCSVELLVVDNACTDGTSSLLATLEWPISWMNFRVVREERLGLSMARNRAIDEATGEYILFLDDDETPDPQWVRAYERVIRSERPDAIGGRIEVQFEDGNRPAWLQDELLGFLGRLDYGGTIRPLTELDTPIFGGNSAFLKQMFARTGLFDAGLGRKGTSNAGGEDTDIYRRMIKTGCSVWWVPDAVIHHRVAAGKLRRSYYLDLHFRQGCTEGLRKRGNASRIPPRYLVPQLWRATRSALTQRLTLGRNFSLRKEMNVAYFLGFLYGWAYGRGEPHVPAGAATP